jgi:hypothetical protein
MKQIRITKKVAILEKDYTTQKHKKVVTTLAQLGYVYENRTISRPCSTCGKITLHFYKTY